MGPTERDLLFSGKSVVIACNLEQVKKLQQTFSDKLPQNEPLTVNDFLASPDGVVSRTLLWHQADDVEGTTVTFKVENWPKHIFFIPNDVIIIQKNGGFSDIRDLSGCKWGVLPYQL